MNRAELVEAISADLNTTKTAASAFLDSFIENVTKTLAKGEVVSLVGFGSFQVRTRAERAGRNPSTGTEIKIKASKTPTFKAGKSFKDAM